MSDETDEPRELLYNCPDCAAEGVNSLHPLSEFYVVNVRDYKAGQHWVKYAHGQRRSAYCKRHENARTLANRRERLDPYSDRYDADLHERQKAAKRATWQKNKAKYRAKKTQPPESS